MAATNTYGVVYKANDHDDREFILESFRDWEGMAKAINAKYIELLVDLGDGFGIYGDEEAALTNKPRNPWFPKFRGDLLFVRENDLDDVLPFEWSEEFEEEMFKDLVFQPETEQSDGDDFMSFYYIGGRE